MDAARLGQIMPLTRLDQVPFRLDEEIFAGRLDSAWQGKISTGTFSANLGEITYRLDW